VTNKKAKRKAAPSNDKAACFLWLQS